MDGEAGGFAMTKTNQTDVERFSRRAREEIIRRQHEQMQREDETAALERIRREVATRERCGRKGMRRASQ
jgi:hypothetical protein